MQSVTIGAKVIKEKLHNIPKYPGIYKMINENEEVLYVGKAKNLYYRVNQYSQIDRLSNRIKRMVAQIKNIECITTQNEMEALILECNLIKTLKPPFNVLMRDDKTYSYLMISKNHLYPRLVKYRGKKLENAHYYGPYPFGMAADMTLTYLQKIFKLRNCPDNEFKNRSRPCLQYYIKRCTGPCVGKISQEEYAEKVKQAKKFLEGKTADVNEYLTQKMQDHSDNLEFEKAVIYRDQLKMLSYLKTKQTLNVEDADVLYVHEYQKQLYVEVMLIRYGRDLGHQSVKLDQSESVSLSEGLSSFLLQYYERYLIPAKVIMNVEPKDFILIKSWASTTKKSETRFQILDSSHRLIKLVERKISNTSQEKTELIFKDLSAQLAKSVARIECYDNSHTQGAFAYGVMVVASPKGFLKSDYKKFQIQSIKKGDDYAMMRQVIRRRFQHIEWPFPDVILIDGGKGQMSVVQNTLNEMEKNHPNIKNITVVAIAKGKKRNDGHERFYVDDQTEMILDHQSYVRYFLQRLRDEAHRFAITTHKKKRDKGTKSLLDGIPQIGEKRKKILLSHFGSVKALASASLDDLELIKGISKKMAKTIWLYFKDK